MIGRGLHVVVSAAVVLLLVLGLWPPEGVSWTPTTDALNEPVTLGIVGTLAVGLGAWFGRTAEFHAATVAIGGVLGFGTGVLGIELLLEPDGTAHVVRYGVLTGCVLLGVVGWWVIEGYMATD